MVYLVLVINWILFPNSQCNCGFREKLQAQEVQVSKCEPKWKKTNKKNLRHTHRCSPRRLSQRRRCTRTGTPAGTVRTSGRPLRDLRVTQS